MNLSVFLQKFSHEIGCLLSPGDSVLVALSGGCDSVCLLHLLTEVSKQYNLKLFAAHLNHQLRETADRDEAFVKELCKKYQIPLFCEKKNIKTLAQKDSIENCARNVRYDFFQQIQQANGISFIATAHHKNDNAESILLHLTRGCGLDGLRTMQKQNQNRIIRPLLPFSRKELEEYAKTIGLSWVEDETNQDIAYSRNRIRHCVIPQIEQLNPAFVDTLYENSMLLSEDALFLSDFAKNRFKELFNGESLDWKLFFTEHPAIKRRILQCYYQAFTNTEKNLSKCYIDAILALSQSGQLVHLPQKMQCRLDFERLKFEYREFRDASFEYSLELGKTLTIPECGISVRLRQATSEDCACFIFPENAAFSIRNRKKGDFFFPDGFGKKKKLSDFFIEKKIPQQKRDSVAIFLCNGEIASILGMRNDARFYKKTTVKNGFVIEIK